MTITADFAASDAGEISPYQLRQMLRQLARFPSLRHKYAGHDPAGPRAPLLAELPVLTRAEVMAAARELRGERQTAPGGYMYAGGGTMAVPWFAPEPEDMFVPDVLGRWRPLDRGDVLANLHPAGRLQSAHYFHNALAMRSRAAVLPFGAVEDGELLQWLKFFEEQGVTAVAAPVDTARRILRTCAATGRGLPWVRKLLWGGMVPDDGLQELVARHLPAARHWALYGAPETGPVGYAGPNCAVATYHPLPFRYVEADGGRILVTVTRASRTPPLLRYQMPDHGTIVRCTCGRPESAVRVTGDVASSLTLFGQQVSAGELTALAEALDEVVSASVVPGPGPDGAVRLHVQLAPGVPADDYTCEWIRHRVLDGHLMLGGHAAQDPRVFRVIPGPPAGFAAF